MAKRIKRLVTLLRVLIRMATHGRADKTPGKISRLIVAPTGKLGDIVCNTPVLAAIRTHFPDAYLIVAGNSKLLRLVLSESGLVDEYLDLEEGDIDNIREAQADAAIVTGPSYEYGSSLYLAGIPLAVIPTVVGGVSPAETRPYHLLKKCLKTFPYKMGEYAPRERLKALEALGIKATETKKHLGFSHGAGERVNEFLVNNNIEYGKDFIVGISPSAGNKIKEWPEEKFAKLSDYIYSKHKAKLLITGSPNEKGKVDSVISKLSSQTKVVGATEFNVDELKALISKLSLFISVDTGPIYIAEAFGIPTIDITGPIDEKEQPPIGPRNRVVTPLDRVKPELFVLNAKHYNRAEALRQIESISVEMVKKEVDSLMSELVV